MRLPGILAAGLALAAAGRVAAATVVALDASSVFNADVVLNDGTGVLDPTQDPIDLGILGSDNFCFPTQSVAVRLNPASPDGLPDDAFFPADAFHPDVRLSWNNADDGLNARRIAAMPDLFTLPVPPAAYTEVHLYATGGDGPSFVNVTLEYADRRGAVTAITVPDWFDDPVPSGRTYMLIDGRDRVQVGSGPGIPYDYEDPNDPAIFGFTIVVDPARTLQGVQVERLDGPGVLDVFGGIAVQADAGPALYESPLAPGLLAPGNVVATGVTSPFDWTPPAGALLHYFVDDGAGSPSLIFVSKSPAGLRFTF
jgi:hypothetical protein